MPGFLYAYSHPTAGSLPASVLPHLDEGALSVSVNGSASPTGSRCLLCRDASNLHFPEDRLSFRADRQTWSEPYMVEGHELRVGIWHDWPPQEADLRRPRMLDGQLLRLGDGHSWRVPQLMFATGGCALPQQLWLRADGTVGRSTVREFVELGKLGQEAWHLISELHANGGSMADAMAECGMTQETLVDFAVRGLGGNYRIRHPEASLLGLVSTENILEIIAALIGLDAKKNDRRG